MPTTSSLLLGGTTVISGKVYCVGGVAGDVHGDQNVNYYDPSQDKWTILPPLPVRGFALGQVNGKLVAVGGVKKICESSEVYTYDEQAETWKQTIPPMPTARYLPGVLSLQSALVVAGGAYLKEREPRFSDFFKSPFSDIYLQCVQFHKKVEVLKSDTLQWYSADPLPIPCQIISLKNIDSTCYALGGYRILEEGGGPTKISYFNQALYASVDDLVLLGNAVPANQTTHSGSSDTQSAWKTLPKTPTYGTVAAELAGNLLAIGSVESTLEIYMHIASTDSWAYIGTLPSQECNFAIANLSPLEILVIAGNSVHKGTPTLFK